MSPPLSSRKHDGNVPVWDQSGDIVVRMSGEAEDSDLLIQKALKGSIFMLGNRWVNVTLRSTALIESQYLGSTDGSTSTVWILVSCRVLPSNKISLK